MNHQLDKLDEATDSAVDAVEAVDEAVRAVSFAVKRPVRSSPAPPPASRTASRRCARASGWSAAKQSAKEAAARREADLEEELRKARGTHPQRRRHAPPPSTSATAVAAPGRHLRAAEPELSRAAGGPRPPTYTVARCGRPPSCARASSASTRSAGTCACPSHSLIPPADDPSTLFIVAGHAAVQAVLPRRCASRRRKRVVSVQKVLRAGGKDTDLEDVGRTDRHCSFFEMLGNFSFGDYFKDEAVDFAWEFVTEHLELDPERLWATVHEGDPVLGLGEDTVAIEAWKRVGIPAERIVRLGKDNFWQAAETGPVRAVLGDLLRPRRGARLRRADCRPGLRLRPLHGVLQPRLHAVRPAARATSSCRCRRQNVDTGLGVERTRVRAPGRRLGLRHRRLPADHGLGRARVRRRLRRQRRSRRRRTACSPTTAAR